MWKDRLMTVLVFAAGQISMLFMPGLTLEAILLSLSGTIFLMALCRHFFPQY